jgi:hypothetical protein
MMETLWVIKMLIIMGIFSGAGDGVTHTYKCSFPGADDAVTRTWKHFLLVQILCYSDCLCCWIAAQICPLLKKKDRCFYRLFL